MVKGWYGYRTARDGRGCSGICRGRSALFWPDLLMVGLDYFPRVVDLVFSHL